MSNEAMLARARFAVVSTIALLIAALVTWRVRTGFSVGDAVLIVVLTLPLLIALPRLLQGHRRTYAWMTLAVTPFLVVAITEAVANPAGRIWAALCLMVAFLLFVLLIAYLRFTRGQT
ncbi:DUF2069 domain-containing protein [Steroidobacter flavus]|uniref:DUF2069 domain-containing protein n=1 Tax=Steroidobacter flavus TaxID=1842136 RepID=A0ABV8T4L4_9GAMM